MVVVGVVEVKVTVTAPIEGLPYEALGINVDFP